MIKCILLNDIDTIVDNKLFLSSDSMKKTVDNTVFYLVVSKVNNSCTDVIEGAISRLLSPLHDVENKLKVKYNNRDA